MGYSPTRITIILALALIALSVFVLMDDSLVLPWATCMVGLLVVIGADALFLPRKPELTLLRHLPSDVGISTPFIMTLGLQNDGLRSLSGAVFDILPSSFDGQRVALPYSLAPDEIAEWKFELSANERGSFTLDRATAVIVGPLRLMRRIVRVSAPATVAVIPGVEILRSNELILKAARDADAGITRARGVGRGGEFESLAPYVPGDPPQSVDWRAYARTGQLAVRRYVPERRRHIMLACDAGRLMGTRVGNTRKVDLALEAMSRVAAAALQRGDLCGIIIFDGEVQSLVPPRAGSGQLAKIVRASLNVKPRHSETAFTPAFVTLNHALPRRALVILATDFDNEAQGWELQRNIAQITRRHVAIVAAMRDPVYHATVAADVPDTDAAYRQLAALTLLEERQTILSRIHSTGVHVIDAEPTELQGPLLNMYGSIVTGGRL